jgi:hypothetical protein
MSERKIWKQ